MSATRPMIRHGRITRAFITEGGVYPQIWNGSEWERGGSLSDVSEGRLLSRKELASHGIPFDPDTVDQIYIRRHGWDSFKREGST